jgi:tetratricopeptide (TPR) repeat protein
MRLRTDRPAHRRRSFVAAPIVAGALALVASACGSSPAASTGTTTPTGSASSLLAAGLQAQRSGNLTVAIADYKQVIALAPTATTAAYADYDLGYIAQVEQNDTAAAATYYRSALAINPNFVNALYNLAIILTPTSPATAVANYQQVIALSPKNADAHLNLGFLYASESKPALAHAEFVAAGNLDPTLKSRIPAGS